MGIFAESIGLILPQSCVICKREVRVSENEISAGIKNAPICKKCLSHIVPLPRDRRWSPCLAEPFPDNPYPGLMLYMPFIYDEFFANAIKSMKFGQIKEVGAFLGTMVSKFFVNETIDPSQFDMIIPIPLSEARMKERGFNQSELIARAFSQEIRVPVITDLLLRSRNTEKQSDISDKSQRAMNVAGAFKINSTWDISGQNIILIDDVATTGFTLNEAASVLMDSGANMVLCVAVCGNRSAKNAEMY